jgi:DNA (cytosine-5)-methyltransferase 1
MTSCSVPAPLCQTQSGAGTRTRPLKAGALFAGYGGLELGLSQVLDVETAWVAEVERAPSRILATRFPGVPNLGDVTKVDWSAVEPVDVISGGSPCQDLSGAGKMAGMKPGTRSGLWASMCDAIAIIRPRLVVWENVRGALSAPATTGHLERCEFCLGDDRDDPMRALGRVLGDLAELGYDAAWHGLRAADVGAPHGRWRVFVLAWATDAPGPGLEEGREGRRGGRAAAEPTDIGHERAGSARDGRAGPEDGRRIALMPTPRATDGTKGGPNQRGSSGDLMLPSAVTLLPTPTSTDHKASGASYVPTDTHHAGTTLTDAVVRGHGLMPTPSVADVEGGRKHRSGARSGELLLNGLAHAQAFGQYTPAIARWESVLGRPAPAPTEPTGRDGAHRLSPRFVEFLMGLSDGWVTDVELTRNEQLKALGNGVVPQQAAAAVRHLLNVREWATRQN